MSEARVSIKTLEDIRSIECTSFSEAVPELTVYDLLARAARATPAQPAIRFLKTATPGEPVETLTHDALFARVTQMANLLAALGVGHEDVVAFLSPNHPDAQCALWAAETAGVACPINFLLRPTQIAGLLEASRAKVVIIPGRELAADIHERALAASRQVECVQAIVVIGDEQDEPNGIYSLLAHVDRYPRDRLTRARRSAPCDRAAMFHTGGTTGMPKLAIHSHAGQAFVAWALARMFDLTQDDVFMNGLPLFHVGGTIDFALAPLSVGGCIVIPSPTGMRNPNTIRNHWRIVEQERVTIISGIPTSIAALLSSPAGNADLSSVRAGITGGSAFPEGVAHEFRDRFGIRVFQLYGMTETSGLISINPPASDWRPSSAGFRLPFTSIRIRRSGSATAATRDCPPGVAGEVLVKGPHVFPGYLSAQQTAAAFDQGWLVTGDLGYLDEDGRLFLTGRAKDVIIRSGHNIDPQIIEETACKHPAVELCAAVGMPDDYAGELPVAYVTLKAGVNCEPGEIERFVAEHIAEPPARPREITILDTMPTTAVGKIFKPRLRCDAARRGIQRLLAAADIAAEVTVEEEASAGLVARITVDKGRHAEAAQRLSFLQMRFELIDR